MKLGLWAIDPFGVNVEAETEVGLWEKSTAMTKADVVDQICHSCQVLILFENSFEVFLLKTTNFLNMTK